MNWKGRRNKTRLAQAGIEYKIRKSERVRISNVARYSQVKIKLDK
jgi:hypothetical protein